LHTTVYRANEFVGKNLLRIKSEKNGKYSVVPDSDVYEKWSQALSSSEELCERAKRFSQDFKQEHVYSIIIPAVVVPDGSLWMMEYDPSGTPIADPRQLEACEFFVGRTWVIHPPGTPAFQEVCLSHIQFFTLSGLRKFVDRLQGQGFWNAMFPSPVMPGPEASR
jgi:hypothetical protein